MQQHGAAYNPAGNAWTEVSDIGAPDIDLLNSAAIWTGTQLLVWGSEANDPMQRAPLMTRRWTCGRRNHTGQPTVDLGSMGNGVMLWTGSELIVSGNSAVDPENIYGSRFSVGPDNSIMTIFDAEGGTVSQASKNVVPDSAYGSFAHPGCVPDIRLPAGGPATTAPAHV